MAIFAGFLGAVAVARVRVVLLGALDLAGVRAGGSTVGSCFVVSGPSLVSSTGDRALGGEEGLFGSSSVRTSGLSVEARAWRTTSESLRFSRDSRLCTAIGRLLAAARLRKACKMAVSSVILGAETGSGVFVSSGGADEERKS